jgi:hypothetical protein
VQYDVALFSRVSEALFLAAKTTHFLPLYEIPPHSHTRCRLMMMTESTKAAATAAVEFFTSDFD